MEAPDSEAGRHARPSDGETPGERPLPPAESLALIETQHDHAKRQFEGSIALIHLAWGLAWGLAWFFGFGHAYLTLSGNDSLDTPRWSAFPVLSPLLLVAVAVTLWIGLRSQRGVRRFGETGRLLGFAWFLAFGVVMAVSPRLPDHGIPRPWSACSQGPCPV